ncbi:hypothetical protein ACXC9Q_10050 [Kribbella sp. CWNU-51]|jgi:hypothetical protein|uniref:hypothetical protein n=1 Tax=unclassified Kribbella TaxID=2644121 RepID=UPI002E1F88B3|nr:MULTISPECIES: hypothetical protein [unclassified Kribbella]
MTAQHQPESQPDAQSTAPDATDPLGPITLPKRTKVGARAMALVGTVGLSTFAIAAVGNELASTWPTISLN